MTSLAGDLDFKAVKYYFLFRCGEMCFKLLLLVSFVLLREILSVFRA